MSPLGEFLLFVQLGVITVLVGYCADRLRAIQRSVRTERGMTLEEQAAAEGMTLCRLPIEGGWTCVRYAGHQGRCLR